MHRSRRKIQLRFTEAKKARREARRDETYVVITMDPQERTSSHWGFSSEPSWLHWSFTVATGGRRLRRRERQNGGEEDQRRNGRR